MMPLDSHYEQTMKSGNDTLWGRDRVYIGNWPSFVTTQGGVGIMSSMTRHLRADPSLELYSDRIASVCVSNACLRGIVYHQTFTIIYIDILHGSHEEKCWHPTCVQSHGGIPLAKETSSQFLMRSPVAKVNSTIFGCFLSTCSISQIDSFYVRGSTIMLR